MATSRSKPKTPPKPRPKPKAKPKNDGPSWLTKLGVILHLYRRELIGSGFLALAALSLISVLGLVDWSLAQWWRPMVSMIFGWGTIPVMVILGVFGFLLTFGRFKEEYRVIPIDIVIGIELLVMVSLGLLHLIAIDATVGEQMAEAGQGGGYIGWGITSFLLMLTSGQWWAVLFCLLTFWLAALGMTFRISFDSTAYWSNLLGNSLKQMASSVTPKTAPKPVKIKPALASENYSQNGRIAPTLPVPELQIDNHNHINVQPVAETTPAKSRPRAPRASRKQVVMEATLPFNEMHKKAEPEQDVPPLDDSVLPAQVHKLPPLGMLQSREKNHTYNPNAELLKGLIEETLIGFDIPAEVVEFHSGPTVTQYEVKLHVLKKLLSDGSERTIRTRVRKVVGLSNDLALALAASPIRIEAPIPGRPYIGIEVPNAEKSFVTLHSVVSDPKFTDNKRPLKMALGRGMSDEAVTIQLPKMPHLLIAGATGSGKSVCLNTLICSLLYSHGPEQLRLLMIDPKMVELTSYNGIPHLIAPVVTDFEQVVGALAWATREMERRYKAFAKIGARNIISYNTKVPQSEKLPYLVVVIDELADLMMMAPDEVERHICRIAQMARATGIHLMIATQRPSVDVITGLIKANFPARIAFAVTSQTDSRVILDTQGAEKLLGQGDMLYMAPDSPKLLRLQGCFVSDEEINQLVTYWKTSAPSPTRGQISAEGGEGADGSSGKLPWTDILAENEKDDLLEEAVKIVVDSQRASTSFLQRRLGIGYPRASRLMDQLEEEGIVGPAEGSKGREVLWKKDRDETDYAELEADIAGEAVVEPPTG